MERFTEWFKDYQDQYVLIGGTAASITLSEFGISFRATKDLDIVLHLEALTPAFFKSFWEFVELGDYQSLEASKEGKPRLYRFSRPSKEGFPFMLELFCRAPDLDGLVPGHLAPLPIAEDLSSLSAILLSDDYYRFIIDGRNFKEGFPPWIGVDRLIPLKAQAWCDMQSRKAQGEQIDSKNIRKHLSDIVRLVDLLAQTDRIVLPEPLMKDMEHFVVQASGVSDPKLEEVIDRIRRAFLQ